MFWIVYDDREFMVFKNKNIFEEWLMNPYLTRTERMALVKMRIDFLVDPRLVFLRNLTLHPLLCGSF